MRLHRRWQVGNDRHVLGNERNIADFRSRDERFVPIEPIGDQSQGVVEVDGPTRNHPKSRRPAPTIARLRIANQLVSLDEPLATQIFLIGVHRGDFYRLKNRPNPRVPADVREGNNLMIQIDLSCGGKRFADRVGLDNGHPKKIQKQVIGRAILPTSRVLNGRIATRGRSRKWLTIATRKIVFCRPKKERLPRIIPLHARRQRSKHHRRWNHPVGREKGRRLQKDILKNTVVPQVRRRLFKIPVVPIAILNRLLRSRSLIGLIAVSPIGDQKRPRIPVASLAENVPNPINRCRQIRLQNPR